MHIQYNSGLKSEQSRLDPLDYELDEDDQDFYDLVDEYELDALLGRDGDWMLHVNDLEAFGHEISKIFCVRNRASDQEKLRALNTLYMTAVAEAAKEHATAISRTRRAP